MGLDEQQVHRPGAFKQANKAHKHGRHRSKGSISVATKGKVSLKTITKKQKRELNRDQRRHQSAQIRRNKRDEVLSKKRTLGGLEFAPFLVAVVPLNQEFDPTTAISLLSQCDDEAVVRKTSSGVTHICIPRFKKRYSLVVPSKDNELDILDTLKVADTVLFLLSAVNAPEEIDQIVDKWGNKLLMSSLAQGLPTAVVALTDLESVAPKKRNEFKQEVQKMVGKWLPEEKLMVLDKNADAINILRRIGDQKRKSVFYRDRRPYLYGEEVEFVPNTEGALGTLKVTGYLKGGTLSVNQLVHIPGLGDFQLAQIDAPFDPNRVEKTRNKDDSMDTGTTTIRVLEKCDPAKQESLDSENIPDPMDAEQTWPTNEDFEMAEKEQKLKKVKKVPKGWSDYQAAWIPDDDAEFQEDEFSGSEDEDEFMDAKSEENSDYADAEDEEKEFDTVTESEVAVNDDKYDQDMDLNAEKADLEKIKAAKTDLMFPDEVDTPVETPARVRFQKYRGLESFRTSPWDAKENLPSDYARIFQFENFDRTKRRILKDEELKEGAEVGWYITVHVKDVSQLMWSTFEKLKSPVVLMGMFPHEHKMSVLNVVLKRTQNYGYPIKSKERLVFQCGFRRFVVNPVFSQHTNGQKHKFERFFQPDSTAVATFYAPIQFPPAPVLCYKEVLGTLVLVATGSLLSCNPDRLIIKRLVLSGHPLKIYKRSAVIRFMFFNREDIIYFKPCKLRTKLGRIGHIKEPLGTHGHMKCVFDGQLKSQDTVLLNLYKRVFPKWTYENLVVSCVNDNMEA
ncbi:pre-rRNA-processing protein TSR1 homolog [Anthonomus grandis grandis]|uniref:pre-rRNA-processing protein TSR1 homolog n=1 Tax=Anthonomus grandis grandis TaxID=2921223 RepID=UPI002165A7B7|nr:pre-rRNA-processing protein TSR1 homolog [Anthonomus grandis grandis]